MTGSTYDLLFPESGSVSAASLVLVNDCLYVLDCVVKVDSRGSGGEKIRTLLEDEPLEFVEEGLVLALL